MKMMEQIINETAGYVRDTLYNDSSGHDWWHVYRVWKTATKIACEEKANLIVVELAALLHDIADWKDNNGDTSVGSRVAYKWLCRFPDLDQSLIDEVCFIVENISFKGAGEKQGCLTLEGQIVQDADRLDAMGAIGIARTFAYGGKKGRLIYDPSVKSLGNMDQAAYVNNAGPTINHFYEKLLLLKDLMNTNYGKKMAKHRHALMEAFLTEFFEEWE